jgi:hypothetical protein
MGLRGRSAKYQVGQVFAFGDYRSGSMQLAHTGWTTVLHVHGVTRCAGNFPF